MMDDYAGGEFDEKLRTDLIAVQQESRNADAALEAGKADTDHTHGFTGTTEPADS